MKNKYFWLAVLAVTLMFAMMVFGCNNDSQPETQYIWNPPDGVVPIQLDENQWTNGTISIDEEQWFTFTATASTQYIHIAFGTLTNFLYVQLYSSSGDTMGNSTNMYSSTHSMSQSVTSGNDFYIKVWPYGSGNGTYQIMFNTSDTAHIDNTWTPGSQTPAVLTENQWADGNIPTSNGEQWFTFTATASAQYVHVAFGTMDDFYMQLYDSNGNTVESSINMYNSISSMSWSVTLGKDYYIKVWPSYGNGTYQITFNASDTAPINTSTPVSQTPAVLAKNHWADGNIPASDGEQWFTFTATASTQYIHINFGTLTDLYVQLYNSNDDEVGSSANMYNSARFMSRSVISGNNYYIKVWPYGSGSGTYQIMFNTSSSTSGDNGNGGDLLPPWEGGGVHTHIFGSWTYFASTAYGSIIYTRSCTMCGYTETQYY